MSVEWILTLVALVLTAGAARIVVVQRAQTKRTTAEVLRLRAIVAENARQEAAIEMLEATTSSVEVTTNIVQVTHQAIASIPFAVLEAIPVTRPVTKVVHEIHDQIAGGVYDAIFGVSRAIGSAGRRKPRPQRPRYDAHPRQLGAPDDKPAITSSGRAVLPAGTSHQDGQRHLEGADEDTPPLGHRPEDDGRPRRRT